MCFTTPLICCKIQTIWHKTRSVNSTTISSTILSLQHPRRQPFQNHSHLSRRRGETLQGVSIPGTNQKWTNAHRCEIHSINKQSVKFCRVLPLVSVNQASGIYKRNHAVIARPRTKGSLYHDSFREPTPMYIVKHDLCLVLPAAYIRISLRRIQHFT